MAKANYDGDLQKYFDSTQGHVEENILEKYMSAARCADETNRKVEAKLNEIPTHHQQQIQKQQEMDQKIDDAILAAWQVMDDVNSQTEQEVQKIMSIMEQLNQRAQVRASESGGSTTSNRDRLEQLYNDF